MGIASKQKVKVKAPRPTRRQQTWTRWLTGTAFQYYILYAIYQYVYTCPAVSTADSPFSCRTGDAIKTHLTPYAQPYYDQYLSSYVDQATPYIHLGSEKSAPYIKLANEKVVSPVVAYATANYDKHGKPHYDELVKRGTTEYNRVVAPKVKIYSTEADKYYKQYFAQHVSTAQSTFETYKPTAIAAAELALTKMYPVYIAALPYAEFALDKAVELLSWASVEGKGWVERRWGMHVEPQLFRIQERLGKTTDVIKETTPSATSNPNASSDSAPLEEVPVHMTEEVRKQIEDDLDVWSTKFSDAGVKGIMEVNENLDKLVKGVMKSHQPKSTALLHQLDDVIESQILDLKNNVRTLATAPDTLEIKLDKLSALTTKHGKAIRDATQAVREYAQAFLAEAYDATAATVDASLDVVDGVQDLGMQELGMKWAWMDGVTYKDWARYHELKKDFATTKQSVVRAGQGHRGLRELTDFAKGVEDAAVKRAETAATEVIALKAEGKAKFEKVEVVEPVEPAPTRGTAPVEPELVAENVEEPEVSHPEVLKHETDNHGHVVSEPNAEVKYHDGVDKPVEEYQKENRIAEQEAYEAPVEVAPDAPVEEPVSHVEVLEHEIDNHGHVVAEPNAEIKYHDGADKPTEEYIAEQSAAEAEAAPAEASVPPPVVSEESHIEVLEHEIDNHGNIVAEPNAEIKYHDGTDKPIQEYIAENLAAEAAITDAEPEEEVEIEKLGEGKIFVQAKMKARKINHPNPPSGDYVDTASSAVVEGASSVASAGSVAASSAASAAAYLSKVVSEAIYGAQPTGTAYAQSVLSDKYSSAYTAASVAIYGTPAPYHSSVVSTASGSYSTIVADAKDTYASAAGAASDKYASAVAAASLAYYGTPTPVLAQATDSAALQYESMKAFISELVSGKEPSFTESVFSRFSALTQPALVARATDAAADTYASASSLAGEGYASAASVAGEGYASASLGASAVYAMMTPPPQLEEIILAASANVEAAVASASSLLYGTTTGYAEAASSAAAEKYASGAAAVSQAIYGKPDTAAEQVQKQISAALVSARESLSLAIYGPPQAYTASVASILSEKVYGTEQGTIESVSSVIGENAAAATAAIIGGAAVAGAVIAENAEYAGSVVEDTLSSASSIAADSAASASSYIAANANPSSASSVIAENVAAVTSHASVMWYGKEKTYAESAQSRLEAAVESARVQLSTMFIGTELSFGEKVSITIASHYAAATNAAGEVIDSASSVVVEVYESATSVAGESYESASSLASPYINTAASAVNSVSDTIASAGNVVYESAASAADGAASIVSEVSASGASIVSVAGESASSVASVVSSAGSNAYTSASAAVVPSSTGPIESLSSAASSATEKIKKAAKSAKEDL